MMAEISLTREWVDDIYYGGAYARYQINAYLGEKSGVPSVFLEVKRLDYDWWPSTKAQGEGANSLFLFALLDLKKPHQYWTRMGGGRSDWDQWTELDHDDIRDDILSAMSPDPWQFCREREICGIIVPEDKDIDPSVYGVGSTPVTFDRPLSSCRFDSDGNYEWPPLVSAGNRYWNYGSDPFSYDSWGTPCAEGDRLVETFPFQVGEAGPHQGDDPVDPSEFEYFPGATYRTDGGLWISHNRGSSSGHGAGRAAIRKNGAWLDELNKSLSLDVSLNKGIIKSNAWTRQELIGLYKDTR